MGCPSCDRLRAECDRLRGELAYREGERRAADDVFQAVCAARDELIAENARLRDRLAAPPGAEAFRLAGENARLRHELNAALARAESLHPMLTDPRLADLPFVVYVEPGVAP